MLNLFISYLTWVGRNEAFKMLLLPKLLYLYHALPIQIPTSFFRAVSCALGAYVWLGKRPRCPYHILIKHRKVGGMGFPDMKDYHVAVVLDQLRHWFISSNAKHWTNIEQYLIPSGLLRSFLLAQSFNRNTPKINHPTIQAALEAWRYFIKVIPNSLPTSLVPIPMEIFKFLIPNLSLRQGSPLTSTPIQNILSNCKLLPFKIIKKIIQRLTPGPIHSFIQISAYPCRNPIPSLALPKSAWS